MTLRIGARSATQNTRQPSRVSQSQWFLCHITCVLKETHNSVTAPNPRLRKKKACSGEVRLESHFNTSEESVCGGKRRTSLHHGWGGGVEVVVQGIEVGLGN